MIETRIKFSTGNTNYKNSITTFTQKKMELVFATNNKHKLDELQAILGDSLNF